MKETNIYLIRHAHSTYTPDEYGRELSQKGREDQERLTNVMKNVKIDAVLSSPYMRAIQTVEGIAKDNRLEIQLIEEFKERILAQEPVENFDEAIEAVWRDEAFHLPGGESNERARLRGVQAFKEVLHTHRGKSVAIGTHGNLMVLTMSYFNNQYDVSFWRELDMPDVYRLTFEGEELKAVNRIWE
ncbi:histidine phosphatase family protein [Pseudalkalibacillus hwajinpoensis]|uniref:Histidine phosphatase family protein n=1 Tax=Guptibacillus hwajinpoensis TaxID=208199 RepID=A0A4U1MJB4_9BACL|nr:histidine phosphatase family protein [Pseudalkalibacillus hwajinpoensis]TKD70897.1 histidine phosphatase family protein [Pseudalkalibacillus hwajinpoensis]